MKFYLVKMKTEVDTLFFVLIIKKLSIIFCEIELFFIFDNEIINADVFRLQTCHREGKIRFFKPLIFTLVTRNCTR